MAGPMRTVSFKLPENLDEAITKLAKRHRSTRSALVRRALEAFAREGGGSVTALAKDLAGSIEGPSGLSTSTRHMVGYGK
jgi:predicted transcriptional regulator